ncbi:hypothetical protein HYQ46_000565 [Verticillium longisporum]|nr:hypothetical protein HYQ46_000565 [Verticillium longisporum]
MDKVDDVSGQVFDNLNKILVFLISGIAEDAGQVIKRQVGQVGALDLECHSVGAEFGNGILGFDGKFPSPRDGA